MFDMRFAVAVGIFVAVVLGFGFHLFWSRRVGANRDSPVLVANAGIIMVEVFAMAILLYLVWFYPVSSSQ